MKSLSDLKAWHNGKVIPLTQLMVPAWDLGLVAGASLTEMARTYHHQPFRLAEHIQRLQDSCDELGFEIPWSSSELEQAAEYIVAENARILPKNDDLGIVVFVTAGTNATYLGSGELPGPTVGIHTFRLPFELWQAAATDGVRLTIPAIRQHSQEHFPVHRKTRNRLHWWLADRQANTESAGSRALLCDREGNLTETSTSCFYAVMDGEIVTPARNVLDSMSRRIVQELAQQCSLKFSRGDIVPTDVPRMSEAFLSSTPTGLLQVHSINETRLPVDGPDPVVPRLLEAWQQLTGVHPRQQILMRDNSAAESG